MSIVHIILKATGPSCPCMMCQMKAPSDMYIPWQAAHT